MARNVFISFRYSDGHDYKEELAALFDENDDTVDFSEDEDRLGMKDETIKKYLYDKLKRSSITIVLITPEAIEYKRDWHGNINDWIYDEVRYSLEDRYGNGTNGLIGVYVPEAEPLLFRRNKHICSFCQTESEVLTIIDNNNLVRKNMMNVLPEYKKNKCPGIYDGDYDSYCSLVAYSEFKNYPNKYIDIASEKRDNINKYTLCKRIY